ncbi:MAG: DNA polymerase III subunit alpha [Lachnospiraceae bacterium]|nr:DNA polymerase III subunit alpha [Lachnospiraceae bacterium]
MSYNLHNHTDYSALDGMSKISELVARAKELGQKAVGLTDHGNMYGVYELYKECKAQDVQPVYGIEFYHKVEGNDERYHLIAYAKSMNGLRTLYKLHALSHKNKEIGLFGREYPIVTYSDLLLNHEDIIITSACIGGHIPKLILSKDSKSELSATIKMLQGIFKDDFYFEIQTNSLQEQHIVNNELIRLGKLFGVKCTIGCDSHYIYKDDANIHEMLLCLQTKSKMSNQKRFKFTGDEYWFKSEEEMRDDLKYIDTETINEIFNNMDELVDKCKFEYEMPLKENCLPKYADDEKIMLRKYCNKGYTNKLKYQNIDHQQYIKRIRYELSVIESAGYSGYFLIVQDYINWAKNNDVVVGGGRGSICGSAVAYTTNITSIDPLKHGLLFERFLNPERLSQPDADVDFNDRDKVVEYLKNRWGKDKVSSIIAFGKLTAKAVIRKILSIHDFTPDQINIISKSLPKKLNLTLQDCESSEIFQKYKSMYPDLFHAMYRLEGTIDHFSTHAAGILITPECIEKYLPAGYDLENDIIISGFDKYTLEEHGLYKFDILKLETLNVINDTLNNIKKFEDKEIDLNEIDYEDGYIYKELCNGNVFGVFQLEEQKDLTMKLQPKSFEDLTLLNTLIRP